MVRTDHESINIVARFDEADLILKGRLSNFCFELAAGFVAGPRKQKYSIPITLGDFPSNLKSESRILLIFLFIPIGIEPAHKQNNPDRTGPAKFTTDRCMALLIVPHEFVDIEAAMGGPSIACHKWLAVIPIFS